MVQEKMNASADTLVRDTSMFLPRKGPIMVRTASTVLAIFGAPLFSSRTAKLSGSCPLRPMASMMRLVAP